MKQALSRLQSNGTASITSRSPLALQSLDGRDGNDNPFVLKIANEVIRLTNAKLREKAVVSRIQMDDDSYEFSKRQANSDVRDIAMRVVREVLARGSGKFLNDIEKKGVRVLIHQSVA